MAQDREVERSSVVKMGLLNDIYFGVLQVLRYKKEIKTINSIDDAINSLPKDSDVLIINTLLHRDNQTMNIQYNPSVKNTRKILSSEKFYGNEIVSGEEVIFSKKGKEKHYINFSVNLKCNDGKIEPRRTIEMSYEIMGSTK